MRLQLLLLLLLFPLSAQSQEQRQKITIAGAQSIVPLAEQFSSQFRKKRPGVEIGIHGGGSNYAVEAIRHGKIDIGLVSRSLSAEEKKDLRVEPFGRDAIILLTYPGNSITNLTLEQLRQIYSGRITNWEDLGGEHKGVIPLNREASSAIHALFTNHIFGKGFNGQAKGFTIRASKEKILRTIKRIEGSIGYGIVRLEEASSQGVKVLGVEGRLPTNGNVREGLYPLIRPQMVISRGGPRAIVQDWMREFTRFVHQGATSKDRP